MEQEMQYFIEPVVSAFLMVELGPISERKTHGCAQSFVQYGRIKDIKFSIWDQTVAS